MRTPIAAITPPRTVVITGMERSGTSLVTRLVNLLGVDLGRSDALLLETAYNPTGCWEHWGLLRISEELLRRFGGNRYRPPVFPPGWERSPQLTDLRARAEQIVQRDFAAASLWGWKDTRCCLTLPFWQAILPRMSHIICVRNPIDVAQSVLDLGWATFAQGVLVWFDYLVAVLEHTRQQRVLLVSYEAILRDVPGGIAPLARFLDLDEGVVASRRLATTLAVDANLQYYRSSYADVMQHPHLPVAIKTLYGFVLRYIATQPGQASPQLPRHGRGCRSPIGSRGRCPLALTMWDRSAAN
jgi:hypothetical protein